MKFRDVLTFAAIGIAVAAGPAAAQTAEENRDADALAADMRLLASNPVDLEALIVAGEITLRMGDTTAAAAFFGRAEKIDPHNARISAGMGSLMVRAERPGEALRRFADAEKRGGDVSKFAADRGLAYDLVGQQERAQRDYRLALKDGPDDEVSRRYALSLAISGRYDEALKQIEPLLNRQDRAAWRDRAFILAMKGDAAGAQKIADTMMSSGVGAGLGPFFERLPGLSPADRSFAVTFGEIRSTPDRLADARLAPPLPKLGPDPDAPRPVRVAAAQPTRVKDEARGKRRKGRESRAETLAPTATPPVEIARATPLPPPPPAPMAPVEVAAAEPARPVAVPARREEKAARSAEAKPASAPVRAPHRAETAGASAGVAPVTVSSPAAKPVATTAPRRGVADQPSASEAGVTQANSVARVSEDSVLARIIAGIDVPGSELGVKPMPERAAPAPVPAKTEASVAAKPAEPATTKTAPARKAPPAHETKATAREQASDKSADSKDCVAPDSRSRTARRRSAKAATSCKSTTEQDKAAKAKPVEDDCPKVARGKAARGKAASHCAAPTKADSATRGEPARVWVQVAGGANEADLEKAWKAVTTKAPALFRGHQGWTTPLRATNRVLTGPFKTSDEAQAFVNKLAGAGLNGFVFTSAKGQKVERLGEK